MKKSTVFVLMIFVSLFSLMSYVVQGQTVISFEDDKPVVTVKTTMDKTVKLAVSTIKARSLSTIECGLVTYTIDYTISEESTKIYVVICTQKGYDENIYSSTRVSDVRLFMTTELRDLMSKP